jgi:eukaryotic-like serine/threonine-protein kinase
MSMIGKTLAHYEITGQLGKGGMGEVYQAKDRKLGRDVAIKVLPEEFAKDADRVARFQREAKLLASLNHTNIAAIHGLEESSGTSFLVLELVEGETLADQIKRGPIPVEESLKLALQIAEALEAAHEKSVIHRDLKPANIKVTPEGKVKVLDFGLAKAFAGEQAELNLSNSPTLSNAATQQGVILGTAAYMSPEQARGKAVDKRADIWAFGCVLFEMLTGRSMFAGEDVSQTLARVLERQPDFSALPPNLHPRIRLLLERCLEKEARNRYGSINDARVDIEKAIADPSGVLVYPVTTSEPRTRLRTILPWVAAVVILSVITGVVVWEWKPSTPSRVMRFTYELPEGQQLTISPAGNPMLAVSPDGSQFVYASTEGLYLRSLDSFYARFLAGTDKDSINPFFSPDGQWIGYFSQSDRKLKKIAISGGAPAVLCDIGPVVTEARWNSDNTIVYSDAASGIVRVPADGGTQDLLVKASLANLNKEGFPMAPQILPDQKTVLFTNVLSMNSGDAQIAVQSLKSGKRKVLLRSSIAPGTYLPTGHIVYSLINNNTLNLLAVPFDLKRLEVTGGSIPVLEEVAAYAISNSGTLVYFSQPRLAAETKRGATVLVPASTARTLVWVGRDGKEEPIAAPLNLFWQPRISPDGSKVALSIATNGRADIWIWDLIHKTLTRLTFGGSFNGTPLWTPDGKRIVFYSWGGGGDTGIHCKSADGAGKEEILGAVMDPGPISFPASWSDNGKTLVIAQWNPGTQGFDIGTLPMEGDRKWKPLLNEKYHEAQPQISPDGRWMVYTSDESGQNQIYVRPFPDVSSGRWQISTSGGDSPLWSRDGREIFYRNGDAVTAVSVKTMPTFSLETPKTLFRGTYVSNVFRYANNDFTTWDISPDGKKFLMMKEPSGSGSSSAGGGPRKINIVVNWFEELKQRVPTK